jgi:hypothetical protein
MSARIWHLPCPIQDNFLQSLLMFSMQRALVIRAT